MNNDYIYWTFSAAAQSISAFVALLLTGYALVHSFMESAREKDDSLDELHVVLRSNYHQRLKELAWLTGAAITLSLLIVYINRSDSPTPTVALAGVATIDLAAIILGLIFVVSIVDPRKYQKAAQKILDQAPKTTKKQQPVKASEFFDAFLHLQKLIRDYLEKHALITLRMKYSFREMFEALRQNEKIDRTFYEELIRINKYRNAVFHGHVDQVDKEMIDMVHRACAHIERIDLTSKKNAP